MDANMIITMNKLIIIVAIITIIITLIIIVIIIMIASRKLIIRVILITHRVHDNNNRFNVKHKNTKVGHYYNT